METKHNIRLTDTEVASLWTTYMNDTLAKCVLTHCLKHVEDAEITPVLEYALHLSTQHIQTITDIFTHENHPVPHGFKDKDVNLDVPRLFSDSFYMVYLHNMSKIGLASYGVALPSTARSDVRDFLTECVSSSAELCNKTVAVLLNKGLYIRSPYIPVPDKVTYVDKQDYLRGWFGERRPLNAIEIAHLYINTQTNVVAKALLTAFSQVAEDTEVRVHLARGAKIHKKHIEVFDSILSKNNLPTLMTVDDAVMSSTIAPFSDKLMMFHTSIICGAEVGNYGAAMGASLRLDLPVNYARLLNEIGLYAEDSANLMIENGWLEQIPLAADREAMVSR